MEFQSGFATKLWLNLGAIPVIHQPLSTSGQVAVASAIRLDGGATQAVQNSPPVLLSGVVKKTTVGIQTDLVRNSKTVATQLGMKTLGPAYKNRGTQTIPNCKDISVGTNTISMDSLRPLVFLLPTQRPRKRPRLELEEDGEEPPHMNHREVPNISTCSPPDSVPVSTESPGGMLKPPSAVHKTHTSIVYESCLLELFQKCPACMKPSAARTRRLGTFISVVQTCPHCKFTKRWNSQPVIGSTPAGNLQLSSALYATGSSFCKVEKVFRAMNLDMPDYDTFLRHARMYIQPAIVHTWKKRQKEMLEQLSKQQGAVVRGGLRPGSAGRLAKSGGYTMMDLKSNKVIDVQLLQSNEVFGGNSMKKEGLKRSLSVLEEHGVTIDSIVTGRDPETQKFLKKANITQYYDVRGIEKGISRKLSKISASRDCGKLKKWLSSIRNHIYWTAASSTSGPERVARWTSVLNHIQNVHKHDNPIFPRCLHPERQTTNKAKWMTADAPAFCRLERVMLNEKVLRDVEKLSPHDRTCSLEAFHRDVLRFASNSAAFPFLGMLCRLYLAALHHNENSARPQAAAASGDLLYRIHFPKSRKGRCSVEPVRVEPTFNYVDELMGVIFEKILCNPAPHVEELLKIPVPDDSWGQFVKADTLEVISSYTSRLNQGLA